MKSTASVASYIYAYQHLMCFVAMGSVIDVGFCELSGRGGGVKFAAKVSIDSL